MNGLKITREWRVCGQSLAKSDLSILSILLRERGTVSTSRLVKIYGNRYVYERLPKLREAGFITLNGRNVMLTQKGAMAGLRGLLLCDQIRRRVAYLVESEMKPILELRPLNAIFKGRQRSALIDGLLKSVAENDELFENIDAQYKVGETWEGFSVRCIKSFLGRVDPDGEAFNETLIAWLRSSMNDTELTVRIINETLGYILANAHYYFKSRASRIVWYIKQKISVKLIILGIVLFYISIILRIIQKYLVAP